MVAASGVSEPVVYSWDGWGVASRFAARHPDRLSRLVLYHPISVDDAEYEQWAADRRQLTLAGLTSSGPDMMRLVAPSHRSDPSFVDWYNRAGHVDASPAPRGRSGTPCSAHRPTSTWSAWSPRHWCWPVATTRSLRRSVPTSPRSRIPDATYVELDGADHFPFLGDVDSVIAEIAAFVVGEHRLPRRSASSQW